MQPHSIPGRAAIQVLLTLAILSSVRMALAADALPTGATITQDHAKSISGQPFDQNQVLFDYADLVYFERPEPPVTTLGVRSASRALDAGITPAQSALPPAPTVTQDLSPTLTGVHKTLASNAQGVYSDQLDNGWQNWGWSGTTVFNNTSPVHGGSDSIATTLDGWGAIWFVQTSLPTGAYTNVTFWINGGAAGGQLTLIQATSNSKAVGSGISLDPLPANQWKQVTVSLQDLGVANDPAFNGFWIQDRTGNSQPTFYLDDVQLVTTSSTTTNPPPATTGYGVYSDQLDNGWQNWGWSGTTVFNNTSPVHGGSDSIATTLDGWGAIWFVQTSLPTGAYTNVTFWINGGAAGGQLTLIQATSNSKAVGSGINLDPLPANQWKQVTVSLQDLGVANDPAFNGFWIQDRTGNSQPTFYLDDVQLVTTSSTTTNPPPATTGYGVYSDQLDNGWQNWGWSGTTVFNNTSPVHGGSDSIATTLDGWGAIWFVQTSLPIGAYTNVTFWINGGAAGGQLTLIQATSNSKAVGSGINLDPLPANQWKQVTVSLQDLGVANDPAFNGFWIQDRTGNSQPTFYLDDIQLLLGSSPPVTNLTVSAVVDAGQTTHPISDLVYGVAFADSAALQSLNVPLNRSGGNSESRYNWSINAHNRAADWYFESIGDDSGSVAGAEADQFVRTTKAASVEPMLTIPMVGWVAKLGPARSKLASFSISKYGAQTSNDFQYYPDAGNGKSSDGPPAVYITGNDPSDANVPADASFQMQWLEHLTNLWGLSAQAGVRYYLLDNEPSLWFSTHRDVHPSGATMDEVLEKSADYAAKIKTIDPAATVVGPEEWGWTGYFYSGSDQQYASAHGWGVFPDRAAHSNWDYLPWFLDQMRQKSTAQGKRLLDVFTVHYYPQGKGDLSEYSGQTEDTSEAVQLLRNRSTRSLWDTNYIDQSWIADKVQLIPRLKAWVNQYYPGTKIGITEYTWGADHHINGATAQADVLGIFGREGLDLATRWTAPATATPAFKAIQMYRNYDGKKSTFGQLSIPIVSPDPDKVALYAARRVSDGAITIMAINKQLSANAPLNLSLTNMAASASAQVWQLTSSNVIARLPDAAIAASTLNDTLPAQSITLYVVLGSPAALAITATDNTSVTIKLDYGAGDHWVIQATSDFKAWSDVATNNPAANTGTFVLPRHGAAQFYRAMPH